MKTGWPRFARRKRGWKPRPLPGRTRNNAAGTRPKPSGKRTAASAGARNRLPIDPTPEDKAQTNFTDPEAKIMKQSNKGFDYSYNAQAVVDGANQIIVAAEVTRAANDKQQAVPMARAALENLEAAGIERPKGADGTPTPIPNTADTGYFSEEAVEGLEQLGMDPYVAVERQKHHEAAVTSATTAPAPEASVKEKMQHKLRTAAGKALYAARKQIVEPVFGQIKVGAGHPPVSVARLGEGLRRVATDLPDPQSSEDLAAQLQRRCELRGIVRAEGWAEAEKAKAQRKPRGQGRNTDEFSDTLLGDDYPSGREADRPLRRCPRPRSQPSPCIRSASQP